MDSSTGKNVFLMDRRHLRRRARKQPTSPQHNTHKQHLEPRRENIGPGAPHLNDMGRFMAQTPEPRCEKMNH
eukprot:11934194-Alexandrium_andersonii.AAC.1